MARQALRARTGRLGAGLALALAAGALALAPAASASAHDYLVSSDPASGSTQTTALSKVRLTFDDRVLDLSGDGSSNVVEVTHGAKHFETGCPTIADTDVTVPVVLGGSGTYTVTWQIVSADGHTVSSSIAFDYAKPAGISAAAGKSTRPTCGDQGSGGGSSSDGSAAAAPGVASGTSSGSSALPIALSVGGGVIVVALVAVAVVLVRSRAAAGAAGRGAAAAGQRPQPKRADRSRRKPPPPPGD